MSEARDHRTDNGPSEDHIEPTSVLTPGRLRFKSYVNKHNLNPWLAGGNETTHSPTTLPSPTTTLLTGERWLKIERLGLIFGLPSQAGMLTYRRPGLLPPLSLTSKMDCSPLPSQVSSG